MTNVWNIPVYQDVMERFSDSEKSALQALQGVPDQLKKILEKTVRSARGKIKAGGGQLGPDCTIPDSVHDEVVSITIWRWITAFSKNDKLQTDARKQNYTDALAVLTKVACGEQRVELPDPGVTDQSIEPSIQERHRRFKHEDGI